MARGAIDEAQAYIKAPCNAGTSFSSSEMTRLNQTADLLRDRRRAQAQTEGANFVSVMG